MSQPYRPPRPVTRIALLLLYINLEGFEEKRDFLNPALWLS
jgi:hypothetical protein